MGIVNPAPRTVCLDFDGVLAEYHGWNSKNTLGNPFPGARIFVEQVMAAGYDVVVYTTRRVEVVADWLNLYGYPLAVGVVTDKPRAMVYIDDRGFRFTGDWGAAFRAITQPTHWEVCRCTSPPLRPCGKHCLYPNADGGS